jgi:predicted enzyme related to lactoylglutathione lyase
VGSPVVQFQILSKNPDRTAEFYTSLFDWDVNADNPLGYRRLNTKSDRGISGGIWPSPPDGHSFVQLFVEVDDLAAYVNRATRIGATVVIPPQQLPEGERMAVLVDPEGIPIAMVQPA